MNKTDFSMSVDEETGLVTFTQKTRSGDDRTVMQTVTALTTRPVPASVSLEEAVASSMAFEEKAADKYRVPDSHVDCNGFSYSIYKFKDGSVEHVTFLHPKDNKAGCLASVIIFACFTIGYHWIQKH